MTRAAFADEMSVPYQNVCNWFARGHVPAMHHVRIALWMGSTVEWFATGSVMPETLLQTGERELLDAYRRLSPANRYVVKAFMGFLSSQLPGR